MKEIVIYIITFIAIFSLYFFCVVLRKKKVEKFGENIYVGYLVRVYKLDIKRICMRDLALSIALINSFIIATTIFVLGFVNHMILKFILGFIVLIPLQLLMYHMIGKLFQKRFKEEK